MPHSHEQVHPDGTGEDWAAAALQDAVRAREAAEAGKGVTWSHLLVEAVAAAIATGDPVALNKQLVNVNNVAGAWRRDLAYRRGDARCLSTCCSPDAAGFHNTKLALN